MLAQAEWKEKEKKKSTHEKLWTSVGFSTGAYSGSNSSAVSAAAFDASAMGLQNYSASSSLSNEATASGVVYSVGMNVGTRLSSRWVLQGGLNYMQQSYAYTSDALMTSDFENYSTVNTAEITKMADGNGSARIVRSSPYNVDNSLKFLSFPVQAGYVLLNRSFAIQMNGGISTDLFLQGTATPEGEAVAGNVASTNEDSRYRPVNFSGLMGTEFSYRFADHYRIALTPGIRYPFNSIFNSEEGLEVRPLTFDVGLRFRYIFH